MARRLTRAERLALHREEMLLARELGCTPKEARAELDRRAARAARARWLQAEARLAALRAGRPVPAEPNEPAPPQWWQRD